MLNFIQANLAPIAATGALAGMFIWVVCLNISYANEKKQEESLRNTDPIHRTCALDTTLQNREFATKVVDSTMKAGFGILDAFLTAALKPNTETTS
jgi:hypothetical protein